MKQKLKMFYECMRPNIALMMVTILVVSLLSVGVAKETKAENSGDRMAWLDAEGVAGKTFEFKGVTTQDCYTEYVIEDGKCVIENGECVTRTVSINSSAELGSRENPYAIDTEEDLILFGKLNAPDYKGKYFMLTKDVYDMQGDTKYMTPLFPCTYTPSNMYTTGFQSNLIGNGATLINVYLKNTYGNNTYVTGLFSSTYTGVTIWDLNMEDAIYQLENETYVPVGGLIGEHRTSSTIINCDISYSINYYSTNSVTIYDLTYYYPNIYNCNTTLMDITSNANLTIESIPSYANWLDNAIYNCSSTIVKNNCGFTTTTKTYIDLSNDEDVYATINVPSSNVVTREGIEIYAPKNKINVLRNGAFTFSVSTNDVTIGGEPCDWAATYNTVKLVSDDDTTQTYIYPAGSTYTLPIPEKENATFLGWTGEGVTEPTKNVTIPEDFVGNRTYIANWLNDTNIEISVLLQKDFVKIQITNYSPYINPSLLKNLFEKYEKSA